MTDNLPPQLVQPAAPVAAAPVQTSDPKQQFIASLPEDLRQDPSFLKYNSMDDFVRGAKSAMSMIGMDKNELVRIPKSDADVKEWDSYYNKIGRPESPDKYAVPDGGTIKFDDGLLSEFRQLAHKNGMTSKQFEETMKWYAPKIEQLIEQKNQQSVEAEKNVRSELKKEWGAAYEQKVNKIDDVLNNYDKNGTVFDKLKSMGAFNDPDVWRFFANVSDDFSESDGGSKGGQKGEVAMTPDQARMHINKNFGDPAWMKIYTDKGHPQHGNYVTEMEKLFKYAHPEQ